MAQVAAIRPKNAAGHRRVSLASTRSRTAGQQQTLNFVPEPTSQALHYDDPPPRPQISARTQALLDAAKQAQDALVERAVTEANRLRVQKEEVSQLFRELRQQKVYEAEEERRRIAREQEEDRRIRLALYEERQNIEYERIRLDRLRREQEIERRKEEILQRRRQLEEERHAQEEAAAEARRIAEEIRQREREEAERIRQERLRQCAVCMDEVDMDLMVQLPCSHWYCVEGLESKFSCFGRLAYTQRLLRCLPKCDPSAQTLSMLWRRRSSPDAPDFGARFSASIRIDGVGAKNYEPRLLRKPNVSVVHPTE